MAISQPQRAGTVKSPYRIPVHELGVNEDQSDAQAFLNGIKNGFGIVGEAGAFYLFFEDQARGEYIRAFRSPLLHGEPARWTAAEEFQPLPKTVPVQQPWYLGWLQWRNDLAARRQDDWNNYSRFVKLPWKEGVFKRPPAPDPNTPDYGVLIDKLIDGQYGMETLGLRPANQFDIDAINRADAEALVVHGRFLQEKFGHASTGGDLALGANAPLPPMPSSTSHPSGMPSTAPAVPESDIRLQPPIGR